MILLGIDTSCDDTSAAVYHSETGLLAQTVSAQLDHTAFGGVVPELASRAHTELILPVIRKTLRAADTTIEAVDAVAVTHGPGLIGSLLVGTSFATALAAAREIQMVGVHHIEGHIFSVRLEHPELEPPLMALVVSGGHTQLIHVPRWGSYDIVGNTRDDAAGEAFDKVAKLLGLGYPGGPAISIAAQKGDPGFMQFPVARVKGDKLAFSFSGLKTAVRTAVEKMGHEQTKKHTADLCASFQDAVIRALIKNSMAAATKYGVKKLALVGGVAANESLRSRLKDASGEIGMELVYPSPIYCTDNAAMIACAGAFYLGSGHQPTPLTPSARMPMPSYGDGELSLL